MYYLCGSLIWKKPAMASSKYSRMRNDQMITMKLQNVGLSCGVCRRTYSVRYLDDKIRCICGKELTLQSTSDVSPFLWGGISNEKPVCKYTLTEGKSLNIIKVDTGKEIEVVVGGMKILFTVQEFARDEMNIKKDFISSCNGILSWYSNIIKDL